MPYKQEEILEVDSLLRKISLIYSEFEQHDQIIDGERLFAFSGSELCYIGMAVNILKQHLEAERYIKESIGTNTTNEQRWSKVAEIMLLKEPGEKLSKYGSDEFCYYAGLIGAGLTPSVASNKVFDRYKFPSQEACDQWLKREITKRQQNNEIFGDLPKPSTAPRTK